MAIYTDRELRRKVGDEPEVLHEDNVAEFRLRLGSDIHPGREYCGKSSVLC
jgi:hypothetical protein